MSPVVRRLAGTSTGTRRRSVPLGLAEGEILVAHVRVVSVVEGRVDGSTELGGAGEPRACVGRAGLVVAVGTRDHHFKAIAPLALVDGLVRGDGCAPESTFEVGDAWGIGAVDGVGVDTRVTFDVHVESFAAVGLVTQRSASKSIKALKGVKTHVV